MEKILYYVRQGQAVFNLRKKMQGWSDSPLTKLCERQAAWVWDFFMEKGIEFDHAYCSTSERCCDTLEIITKMPYTRTKKLKEMCYGLLEGRVWIWRQKIESTLKHVMCSLSARARQKCVIGWLVLFLG